MLQTKPKDTHINKISKRNRRRIQQFTALHYQAKKLYRHTTTRHSKATTNHLEHYAHLSEPTGGQCD